MRSIASDAARIRLAPPAILRSVGWPRERVLRVAGLAGLVVLAAGLRFANLSSLGYVNHYYSAATTAMLQSWHNFFFVAAEPGGSVSIDKPPAGLWLQAISAFFFGVNAFGVLLPQLLAGVLSVVLLYHLVRRSFGTAAGFVAGLVLAVTPVVIATDRNNTMDSTLMFVLLLAAWAFIVATERGSLKHLLVGAALVGVGFNVKMLQAYLPLPAFYGLYFLGSRERLLHKVGRLALATGLLVVVSFAWVAAVDLTPADQRPYVGSSGDNSELSLIFGYNGMQRLMGMGAQGGSATTLLGRLFGSQNTGMNRGFGQPPAAGNGTFLQPPAGGFNDGRGARDGGPGIGGGPGSGGFAGGTQPGLMRLLQAPLSKEASWLLPAALLAALLLLFRTRLSWPLAGKHQALVLWGGWLLIAGVFFSIAGFFHEYYLSMLAAPIAALAGIGIGELWHLRGARWWLALPLLLVGAGATLWLQVTTAGAYVATQPWLPAVAGLLIIGVTLLIAARGEWRVYAGAGVACIVAALIVIPGIWSVLTVRSSSSNQSLPAAYDGRSTGPALRGGPVVDTQLLSFLQANTQGIKYLMAVPSSMQGADYVLATGRPVLYLGGFMGQDQVETGDSLAKLVAAGELRYIYWGGESGRGGFGGHSSVSSWVSSACSAVTGFETQTRNSGAPDGTSAGSGRQGLGFGNMQVALYDCAAPAQ